MEELPDPFLTDRVMKDVTPLARKPLTGEDLFG